MSSLNLVQSSKQNMEWYLYSIIAMFSFSGMILIIKRIRDMKFHSREINLFLYGFVFLGFFLVNISSIDETINSPKFSSFLAFVLVTSVFSIFANLTNIKAIGLAPNPGYSQAVKDANILPVTILSALIFGSEFDLIKFLGALLILGGVFLIIKKESLLLKRKTENVPWYMYSLGAVLFFTLYVLTLKKVTLLGFSSEEINLFLFGFGTLGLTIMNLGTSKKTMSDRRFPQFLRLVFLASCLAFVGNFFGIHAVGTAPNPGYHQAIKTAIILVTTFLSAKFFSSEITFKKTLGAGIIILGVILIVL